MKSVAVFTVKATATTDGTKKAMRDADKRVKDALKAIAVDGVKLVVKQMLV